MARYAIIDLGSNTVRLVIYDVAASSGKRLSADGFDTILDEKKVAGLSSYVEDGVFTKAGMEKAADVLAGHLETARKLDCKKVRIFATAVLRNCTNSSKAVKGIERAIDHEIDLLSGEDEAHLGFVGAALGTRIETGTLVDIGGGSTELTCVKDARSRRNVSLDLGSVAAYAAFVRMILPTPSEMADIAAAVSKRLAIANENADFKTRELFGIGGGVRAVAKMLGRMRGSAKAAKAVARDDVDALLSLLETDPSDFAHLAAKATPDRLHTLVPAAVILHTIMTELEAERLTLCKYGLREGYLSERILK